MESTTSEFHCTLFTSASSPGLEGGRWILQYFAFRRIRLQQRGAAPHQSQKMVVVKQFPYPKLTVVNPEEYTARNTSITYLVSSYLVTQLYLVDSFATVALFLYEEEMLIVSGVDISCSGMRLRRTSWTAVTTWPGCWPAPSSSSPCRSPAAPSMTSY